MRKWIKWTGCVLAGIFLLLVILILCLHTSPVKRFVRDRLQNFLSAKIAGGVHIASVNYRLPKWVELDGVFLIDKKGDTLLYGKTIRIDVNMFKLLQGKYEVNKILLESIVLNVARNAKDSSFNYQFLVDAFAGKKTGQTEKKSPLSISLDQFSISHSFIRWNDLHDGTIMAGNIGSLDVKMNSIDFNTLAFDVNTCSIADMRFDIHLYKPKLIKQVDSVIQTATVRSMIKLSKLRIERSHFGFNGEDIGVNTNNDIGVLKLTRLVALWPSKISVDQFELDHSAVSLDLADIRLDLSSNKRQDTSTNVVVLFGKQVHLSDNTVTYNHLSKKAQKKGFDADHIKLTNFNADVSDVYYAGNHVKALVRSMSGKDHNGFVLDTLRGNFDMKDSVFIAKAMLVKTPSSYFNGDIHVYPATFADKYRGPIQNKILINNTIIAKKDIELLVPSVTEKYKKQLQGIFFVYINADMAGNADRMSIKNITIHSNKNDLYLDVSGLLYNLSSKNKLHYDLSISKISVAKSFIDPFVNTNGKQNINLPPSIYVSGKVNGNMTELNNDLAIISEYGTAILKGQLKNFTKPDQVHYNIHLLAKELETGKWLYKDSLVGKANGTIVLKGKGIDYKTADIVSEIDLISFNVKKHLYKGIHFNVNGTAGVYDVKGKITDSLLQLSMNVHTSLHDQYLTAIGKLNIQNADLFSLGLYKTPLRLQTKVDMKLKNLTPESLDAFLRFDSTLLYKDEKIIHADSMVITGIRDSGKTMLSLHSHMADAVIKGAYTYDQLGTILQGYLAKYDKTKNNNIHPSVVNTSFDMAIDLKPDPLYAFFLPGLFFDKNIHATVKVDTNQKDSSLVLYVTAPSITYLSNHIANLRMNLDGLNDSVKYAIQLDTLRASSLRLYTTSVTGGFSNNHVSTVVVINDAKKKEKYSFALTGTVDDNLYIVHLEDKLKLNYADWIVNKENRINYSNQGININHLQVSKASERISVNSIGAEANAPIDVKVSQFSLRNITGLFNRDSLEIEGVLNAQVKVAGLDKPVPLFSGTIKLDSLAYQSEPVGNLQLDAQTNNTEAVTFNGSLTGRGNNVSFKGTYDQAKINANIQLDPVLFASIEPFTQHTLARSSGRISGNIAVTGDVRDPQWNGSIRFDSAFTQLAKYGTVLKMIGQEIGLHYPLISFSQFTIKDSLDHSFIIDGTVKKENGVFNTNLTVKAIDFTALDNNAVTNNEIYGKAIVDVDITVMGDATAPNVSGNLALKDKSVVAIVRQQSVASAKDREGVMEFVNMDTIQNMIGKPADILVARSKASASMLNYNLNIDIDKEAKFIVIIDPLTRDELQVQGPGQLNAGVNPNGDISITGAYNLTKGSYQLNNKFLKRKFILQEGSTIVLSGDPKDAEVNITAVYDINASPYDLVSNELSDYGGNNSKVYSQKIPFQVILKIKGKLLMPTLEFDVQLKANTAGINYNMATTIDNKLLQMRNDPSTMNKQVFALLVMGRFIGDQSQDFFAGTNGNALQADQIVKESVSRFLSDAVNQLASDLIKGVDIDVNLRTVDNYSTATQRTDLSLGLSKRFINDRLSVSVGKSFTVDGVNPTSNGQANTNSQFMPDITTTYKLSRDGRYMLKAYQRNVYEAILDGYFVETGVAFTLTMDYNKFKDLFVKKKK